MSDIFELLFKKRFCLPINNDNDNNTNCSCDKFNHVSCLLYWKYIYEKG